MEQFANTAATTLASAITSTSATSISVSSATAFPSAGNFRILIGTELLLVTAVSGTTWTVARGQESTTAATAISGAAVTEVLTAGALAAFRSDSISSGTHSARPTAGVAGRLYLETDTFTTFLDNGSSWVQWGVQPVAARVYNNSAQSISGSFALNTLSFPTKDFDDGGYWSSGANTKLTAPATGRYLVGAVVRWAANNNGQRQLFFNVNGSGLTAPVFISQPSALDPNDPGMALSGILSLSAGDYVTACVAQDSGGSLNAGTAAFWIQRVW